MQTISPDQAFNAIAAQNETLEEQQRQQTEEHRTEIEQMKVQNAQLQAQMDWLAVSFIRITY